MAHCSWRACPFQSRAWLILPVLFSLVYGESIAQPPSTGLPPSSASSAQPTGSAKHPASEYQSLSVLDGKAELSSETKAVLDAFLTAGSEPLAAAPGAAPKNGTDRPYKSRPTGEWGSSAYPARYDYSTPIYGPPPPPPSYVPPSSSQPPFGPGWDDSTESELLISSPHELSYSKREVPGQLTVMSLR